AHGKLPVPAPATAILLEGVELASGGPVEGEATTPTGAALLRVLSAGAPPARWRVVGSGGGAGQRNPKTYPHGLRVLGAERAAGRARLPLLQLTVQLSPEGSVRVKVLEPPDRGGGREGGGGGGGGGGSIRLKSEYDDVLVAARALGKPPLEVARIAERDAERL